MNKYLIALSVDGDVECGGIRYQDFDVIESENPSKARDIYNIKHNCSYYYGTCMAEKVDGKINILNDEVSYKQVNLLNLL